MGLTGGFWGAVGWVEALGIKWGCAVGWGGGIGDLVGSCCGVGGRHWRFSGVRGGIGDLVGLWDGGVEALEI